jgi:type I restriction-modification system DNA methylase subunit
MGMRIDESAALPVSDEARKRTGSHYTPASLAQFVARQIVNTLGTCKAARVLDPAVGDGELLCALAGELTACGTEILEAVGYETNHLALQMTKRRLARTFPTVPAILHEADFLKVALADFDAGETLFSNEADEQKYGLIIANPPYVRTQVLGAAQAQRLAKQFGLTGRVDLYHAFIEAMARVLQPGGLAGIIVSNRFMTTRGGMSVRSGILRKFDVLHVFDLGDTKLFEAAVLPAVLLLRRKNGQSSKRSACFTSIYSVAQSRIEHTAKDVISALDYDGVVQIQSGDKYLVRKGKLECGRDSSDVWRIATAHSNRWLGTVTEHSYCTFGNIGKIRVGVKTTADKVFIRSDWERMPWDRRPELLRPLTTHHIARRFKPKTELRTAEIVYPHYVVNGNREVVDLDHFPRTAAYFKQHKAALERRTYVTEAGRKWFEIWVPQDPELWPQLKLVFRDISETPTFWMDTEGTVINGDCYWLTCNNLKDTDLLWLALGVGNSPFIEAFYDHRFHNKLYSGRRRFMTQYVEAFPLPNPDTAVGREIIGLTKDLYDLVPSPETADVERRLNLLVWRAFGLGEEISR